MKKLDNLHWDTVGRMKHVLDVTSRVRMRETINPVGLTADEDTALTALSENLKALQGGGTIVLEDDLARNAHLAVVKELENLSAVEDQKLDASIQQSLDSPSGDEYSFQSDRSDWYNGRFKVLFDECATTAIDALSKARPVGHNEIVTLFAYEDFNEGFSKSKKLLGRTESGEVVGVHLEGWRSLDRDLEDGASRLNPVVELIDCADYQREPTASRSYPTNFPYRKLFAKGIRFADTRQRAAYERSKDKGDTYRCIEAIMAGGEAFEALIVEELTTLDTEIQRLQDRRDTIAGQD